MMGAYPPDDMASVRSCAWMSVSCCIRSILVSPPIMMSLFFSLPSFRSLHLRLEIKVVVTGCTTYVEQC